MLFLWCANYASRVRCSMLIVRPPRARSLSLSLYAPLSHSRVRPFILTCDLYRLFRILHCPGLLSEEGRQ